VPELQRMSIMDGLNKTGRGFALPIELSAGADAYGYEGLPHIQDNRRQIPDCLNTSVIYDSYVIHDRFN
jgi:hypothetical protein